MAKRKQRAFTKEFKAEAVRLVFVGDGVVRFRYTGVESERNNANPGKD